jgi:hypothetical protein
MGKHIESLVGTPILAGCLLRQGVRCDLAMTFDYFDLVRFHFEISDSDIMSSSGRRHGPERNITTTPFVPFSVGILITWAGIQCGPHSYVGGLSPG